MSRVLRRSRESSSWFTSSNSNPFKFRMLIVVVVIFFCCWTPSYIWWLLLMAGDSFEVRIYNLPMTYKFIQSLGLNVWNPDLNTVITLMTYISSCTNPITYCFLNKKFRNAVYSMFGKKKILRHHFQKVSTLPRRKRACARESSPCFQRRYYTY